MLSHFSSRRYVWQEKALDEIYKNLWKNQLYKDLRNVDLNAEKIIVVCGIPQSGKTELVLQLSGISSEYSQKAYELSRGTRTRGQSSTSTAICYHVSDGDYYALAEGDAEPNRYTDEDDFVGAIDELRERVKNGAQSINVMHIYFPQTFFSSQNRAIEVIDLPGINTSDKAEKKHVEAIYAKYLPIATSILVVCRSNKVTQFEKSPLNDVLERYIPKWKIYSERFILVITYAFSGSSYLQSNVQDKESSEQLIEAAEIKCVAETRRHLMSEDLKIIPIDVGDSIRYPCKNNNLIKHGVEFVEAFKSRCGHNHEIIVQTAEESINRAPLAVLTALTNEIHALNESYLNDLKEIIIKKNKEIDKLNKTIADDQESIDFYKEELEVIKKAIKQNEKEIDSLMPLVVQRIDTASEKCKEKFEKIRSNIGKIDKNYLDECKSIIFEFASCINMNLNDHQISIPPLSQTELAEAIDSLADDGYSIFNRKKFKHKKEYNATFIRYIEEVADQKKEKVRDFLMKKRSEKNFEERKITAQEQLKLREDELLRKNTKLLRLKDETKKTEDDISTYEKLDANVGALLQYYIQICNQEYTSYRSEIIKEINSDITADIKFVDLFLLGLIEQDYRDLFEIIGGGLGENI